MPSATLPHLTRKAVLILAAGLGFPQQALTLSNASRHIPVTILADTNRDGRVDALDAADKHTWTANRGAIFLPNIGDELHRCYIQDAVGTPLSNQELAACNDAAGDLLINSTLAAPLKTMPLAGLSADATGRILVQPAHAAEHVRVFWRHVNAGASSAWAPVQSELSFNSTALAAGLTLAVDARHVVSDAAAGWDGQVNMTFEVTDGARSGSDSVAMRQAPVLVHHHLQAPDTVVTMQTSEGLSPSQAAFVAALEDVLGRLDPPLPLLVLNDTDDVWAQDFMEPAFASMPGPAGPISIRVLLRSAQSTRPNGRRVFTQFRGSGVGGWQPGPGSGFGFEEINSGGNFETLPPYTSRAGVRYAHGRVVLGKHFDKHPAASVMRFLAAQREQAPPLFVETGWLAAGQVDETLQFLPSDRSPLGFTVAVPDSRSALDTLRRLQGTGHGAAPFLTYAGDMDSDRHAIFADPSLRNTTVDALLADADFIATNAYGQRFVDRTVAQLLAELPMRDADVVRVPALWKDSAALPWPTGEQDGIPPRIPRAAPGERQLQTIFPLALNGLVLGRDYLAPKPFGPLVDGVDVLERQIGRVYAEAGMRVVFMDDYMSHHVRGGEIHCGTNTLRRTDVEWWKTAL